ncbi:hypothetical protein ACPD8N_07355 [Lacticaseibacillus chiayiensis]|uniref:hypothetical protein n=1 Tax=Lacticaseibacillus chiayiensis TaxID=2100821 RepID=UPI003C7882D3
MFDFSVSLLFFWIKGHLEVDGRFIKTKIPNVILWFIPLGAEEDTVPLKNVSNLRTSTKYRVFPIILGAILVLSALGSLGTSFIGALIVALIGVGIFGTGIQKTLSFDKSGSVQVISVPFYESGTLVAMKNKIVAALSDDTDKTDLNLYFDKKSTSVK